MNINEQDQQMLKMVDMLIKQSIATGRKQFSGHEVRFDSRDLERGGLKVDANETAVLSRQLNQVLARVYSTNYGVMKGRGFVPQTNEVMAGKMSYSWKEYMNVGEAKLIANGADDFPLVDTYATEEMAYIKPFATGFEYTIFELQRAAAGGENLDTMRALVAREAYEKLVDSILRAGLPAAGLYGMTNQPTVTVLQAANTGTGPSRLWSTKTGQLIIDDLNTLANYSVVTSLENEIPDTILLSTARYMTISQTPFSTYSQESILQVFLKNSKYVKNVDSWSALNTADAAGTGPRAICYQKNPMKVSFEEPVPFTSLPPQAVNFGFKVPCYGALGGVKVFKPISMTYMDAM